MSRLKTVKAGAMAGPAVLAIRKPLRIRLNQLCAERKCTLEVLADDVETMRGVFSYVWVKFPDYIKSAVSQDMFVQYCMQERHRLIDEVKAEGEQPGKMSMLQRIRAKKKLKQEASALEKPTN